MLVSQNRNQHNPAFLKDVWAGRLQGMFLHRLPSFTRARNEGRESITGRGNYRALISVLKHKSSAGFGERVFLMLRYCMHLAQYQKNVLSELVPHFTLIMCRYSDRGQDVAQEMEKN